MLLFTISVSMEVLILHSEFKFLLPLSLIALAINNSFSIGFNSFLKNLQIAIFAVVLLEQDFIKQLLGHLSLINSSLAYISPPRRSTFTEVMLKVSSIAYDQHFSDNLKKLYIRLQIV